MKRGHHGKGKSHGGMRRGGGMRGLNGINLSDTQKEQIRGIHETVHRVLDLADTEGITTAAAADLVAERRIEHARMTSSAGD